MKKCTLDEGFMNTFMNTFLPLMNTMNTLRIKYYFFNLKKKLLRSYILHYTSVCLKVFIVFIQPVKCSYKCSLSVHTLFIFGGFLIVK
jgi:predicted neutral ceramidase superfamily lipid hydrolase